MRSRQPLPRTWLMTDERMGDRLLEAVGRLPDGGGIVVRHRSLPDAERRRLFDAVKARAPGPVFLAGSAEQALSWGADGSHGRGPGSGLRSAPVHDLAEIRQAEADGASFLFLSPVFPTRSHPGGPVLGKDGFERLAAETRLPVIALGGMNEARAKELTHAQGWAGIDAFLEG